MELILLDRHMKDLNPLTCGWQDCPPCHRFGPAVRQFYLLHYVTGGRGTFCAGGKEYTVSAGEFFLIRPGEVTVYEADREDPWHYLWFGFDGELASRLDRLPSPVDKLPPSIFLEFRAAADKGLAEWEGVAEQFVASLLHRILAEMFAHRQHSAHYARRAETHIRTRYMEDVSIEEIARSLSLDRRYLSRLFKSSYGMTMQQYLLKVRLDNAAILLKKGHSVSESAALCGYADVANFSKMFRRRFGMPPSGYAEK